MFYSFLFNLKFLLVALGITVAGGFYVSKVLKERQYEKEIYDYSPLEKCLEDAKGEPLKVRECLRLQR